MAASIIHIYLPYWVWDICTNTITFKYLNSGDIKNGINNISVIPGIFIKCSPHAQLVIRACDTEVNNIYNVSPMIEDSGKTDSKQIWNKQ